MKNFETHPRTAAAEAQAKVDAEPRGDADALAASQRQNQLLAGVLDRSSQPFGVGYPDGRLGLVNQAFEQLTGYTAEELRSTDWANTLTPPEWRDLERKKLEELQRTGQPVRYEKEYLRKDGTRVPIELLVHLARDSAGKPEYYYSFLTDITERKQAEKAVREIQEQYRNLFDTLLEGFCIIEMVFDAAGKPIDYRFLEINPSFEKQTGLHDAQGKLMRDLAPAHEAHWFEIYGKVALTGEPARFVNEAKALDRWYDVSAYRIGGTESRKVAILFSDITEAKRAEQALRESERRVRQKLESILLPEADLSALELADIIDVQAVQSLMDDFHALAPIPMAIIDLKGEVLVGVGWQQICTQFHRVNPQTSKYCVESDTQLSAGVAPGESKLYKCKNHMWDVATPILVGGHHVGNLFTGQFFFEGEPVDRELFRAQARQYGFAETAYLAALDKVPRLTRESMKTAMAYFSKLADMISKLSYGNIMLARTLAEREALTQSLRANNEELTRFNRAAVGRELRMVELKQQVNELLAKLGQPPRYQINLENEIKRT